MAGQSWPFCYRQWRYWNTQNHSELLSSRYGGPVFMTSWPELQVGTGNGVLVGAPLGSDEAVLQRRKWCCCRPVVVVTLLLALTSLVIHDLPSFRPETVDQGPQGSRFYLTGFFFIRECRPLRTIFTDLKNVMSFKKTEIQSEHFHPRKCIIIGNSKLAIKQQDISTQAELWATSVQ